MNEGCARHVAPVIALALAVSGCDANPTALIPSGHLVVSAGYNHTCAVTASGSAYCWGDNRSGQLGVGSSDTIGHPAPLGVSGGLKFAAISAGERRTCALTASGNAYCWGDGAYGALGNGDTLTRKTPAAVAGGHRFVSISVGSSHVCALTATGGAYCWGNGVYGQLGNGTNAVSNVPAAVSGGLPFTNLSAGETHTCGAAGSVAYCWGINAHGALGSGSPTGTALSPAVVSGNLSVAAVRAGFRYSCAATTGGSAYCWGLNLWGEVGAATPNSCLGFSDDFFPCSLTPLSVSVTTVTSIAVGAYHTCALTADGQTNCWGANWSGQLGDGTTAPQRQTPAAIAGGLAFKQLTVGGQHTCAITADESLYCWGANLAGQIGDGSATNRSAPVKVTLPL